MALCHLLPAIPRGSARGPSASGRPLPPTAPALPAAAATAACKDPDAPGPSPLPVPGARLPLSRARRPPATPVAPALPAGCLATAPAASVSVPRRRLPSCDPRRPGPSPPPRTPDAPGAAPRGPARRQAPSCATPDVPAYRHRKEKHRRDNDEHRRCIIACLVKGTYVLQRDRITEFIGRNALAPAWWESFHFRRRVDYELECACSCVLCCPFGGYIYGAVFEYVPPDQGKGHHPSAPRYVVAFRGTMRRNLAVVHDMLGNLRILLNRQHECRRFSHARQMVQELLAANNNGGVWLAGHSLGASMALDVGRHMMTSTEGGSVNLPTFLFNPPHVSLAPAIPAGARRILLPMGDGLRHVLGNLVPAHRDRMEELFEMLRPWAPNLYVNPGDPVCLGFIHYFERLERRLSFRDMLYHSAFRGRPESEQQHLLPSAILWRNESQDCKAHKLYQWWQPQGPALTLRCQRYT
ncbi:hypothetical protein BS78_K224000 [Paspalum vaginatum]|uniref:Fungal lipase-like domain-containing protein n=1 Tax=Paspalum vaginatum TaxID=158149 RepID=A0A9W7XED0_9POAL|nr:hypothetical protein BS78_K224000 [Paspalum vaginatum]